jgi:hypothetical protein
MRRWKPEHVLERLYKRSERGEYTQPGRMDPNDDVGRAWVHVERPDACKGFPTPTGAKGQEGLDWSSVRLGLPTMRGPDDPDPDDPDDAGVEVDTVGIWDDASDPADLIEAGFDYTDAAEYLSWGPGVPCTNRAGIDALLELRHPDLWNPYPTHAAAVPERDNPLGADEPEPVWVDDVGLPPGWREIDRAAFAFRDYMAHLNCDPDDAEVVAAVVHLTPATCMSWSRQSLAATWKPVGVPPRALHPLPLLLRFMWAKTLLLDITVPAVRMDAVLGGADPDDAERLERDRVIALFAPYLNQLWTNPWGPTWKPPCTVCGDARIRANGLCGKHYQQDLAARRALPVCPMSKSA